MGQIHTHSATLLPCYVLPSPWLSDLKSVQKLIARFSKIQEEFGFGVSYETFAKLYEKNISAAKLSPAEVRKVYSLWDTNHNNLCDSLQIFAGSLLISTGEFKAKISALFTLFDMDSNGSISRDEMTILIRASINGWCRMCNLSPPQLPTLLEYAKLAFKSADRQNKKDNKIEAEELYNWALATPECVDIVCKFNTLDTAEIKLKAQKANQKELNALKPSKPAIPTIHSLAKSNHNHNNSIISNNNNENDSKSADFLNKVAEAREIRAVFDELDVNKTGLVSFTELNSALKRRELKTLNSEQFLSSHSHARTDSKLQTPRTSQSPSKPTSATQRKPLPSAPQLNLSAVGAGVLLLSHETAIKNIFSHCSKAEYAQLIEQSAVRPIPESLIKKIKHVFDELDRNFSGTVEFQQILSLLKNSARLAEYITINQASYSNSSISLHDLLRFLFESTHKSQLPLIISWAPASKSLSSQQKLDLQQLFELYDADRSGFIDLAELRQSAQDLGMDAEELFEAFDFDSNEKIDLFEFQKFYREIWVTTNAQINFKTNLFKHQLNK
jgi:Ca2+-binding EF-hand superfamily protein